MDKELPIKLFEGFFFFAYKEFAHQTFEGFFAYKEFAHQTLKGFAYKGLALDHLR